MGRKEEGRFSGSPREHVHSEEQRKSHMRLPVPCEMLMSLPLTSNIVSSELTWSVSPVDGLSS